ncbi:hypothetical protein [Gramella sp. AN32]|uniref:Uncharacterized protein n=1 Tax=Christiangramia antarctica TaxID=2058158 RepID=A0ABW5X0B5_9FLAO|nr:hypothetical protein [Gramella sp. AN32]MCM4154970.1 hypothetical protein [Gramella sp. AN32]
MDEFPSTDLFSKERIKLLKNHLRRITKLYTKPITGLKEVLFRKQNSLDIFIIYFLYFFVFNFFWKGGYSEAVNETLKGFINTCIVFIVLLPAFIFFKKIYNIRIRNIRLFRLTFVIRLLFYPLIISFLILYQKFDFNYSIIILLNLALLLDLVLILYPLLLKISISKKVIWIIINYFSLLVFIYIVHFKMPENKEFRKITKSLFQDETPYSEYINFRIQYNDSDLNMNEDYYAIILVDTLNKKRIEPLYPSPLIIKYIDKQSKVYSTYNGETEVFFNPRYDYNFILNYNKIQVFKKRFNDTFYQDLKLADSFKNNSDYPITQKYLDFNPNIFTNLMKYILIRSLSTINLRIIDHSCILS